MKIFVIGPFDSIYMFQYVKEVLCDKNFKKNKEYFFFHSGGNIKNIYLELYNKVAEFMYYEKTYKRKNYSLIEALNDVNDIDVVHIHYIKIGYYKAIKKYRKNIKKIILTAWGSDFLRLNEKMYNKMNKFVEMSDIIVAGTDNLRNFVIEHFDKNLEGKIVDPQFGTPVIDEIRKLKEDKNKSKCCNKLNVNNDKFVVGCGYNGSEAQQHIKIIKALDNMDKKYKKKIFIHVPAGYGLSREYKTKLESLLKRTDFEYKIDEMFYEPSAMAKVRMATDIFIHGQITDASSSSVFEYVYADTVLVNGKWLHYSEIDKYKLAIIEYDSFDELPLIVSNIIDNYYEEKKLVMKNRCV